MMKKIILGVVGLFVLLIVIGVASGGDSKKVGTTSDSNQNETTQANGNESPSQSTYAVGDKVQMGKVILSVNEVDTSTGGQYTKPSEGNIWVNLNLTIENTGSTQEYVTTLGQMFLVDDQNNQYQVSVTDKRMENPGSMGLDGAIIASAKKTDWVGFEVPATAKGLKFQYQASFYSNKNIVVDLSM